MFSQRFRRPLHRAGDDGFTMVEMMIAVFVIGVGLMALASVAITSLRSIRISRERQDAVQIASSVLEEARSYDYTRIALATADYSGPSTVGGETVVLEVDGQVPHSYDTGGRHSVVNLVTRTADGGKRVTTTVSWNDRGAAKSVTEETIVAEARRGLPVPNFQLSPETASKQGIQGETICYDHTLTNLGEQDSYSWQLFRRDNSGNWVAATFENRNVVEDGTSVTRQGFKVPASSGPGQGWFAWARMGPNTGSLQAMVDANADNRPDSANPVARRAENVLRVCYTPKDSSGTLNTNHDPSASFMVRVYSTFDDTVLREVTDSLTVITSQQRLRLHHVYANTGNNVGSPKPPNQHNYKLVMDTTAPLQTDPNYNFDPTNGGNADPYPGLKVPVGTTVLFDFQNVETVARTIASGDGVVTIYGATQTSMTRASGDPADPIELRLSLAKFVAGSGNTSTETALTQTVAVTGSVAPQSFAQLGATIPMNGATLNPGEYLRLKVTCPATAPSACHLAYDVAGFYPSDVVVTFQ